MITEEQKRTNFATNYVKLGSLEGLEVSTRKQARRVPGPDGL